MECVNVFFLIQGNSARKISVLIHAMVMVNVFPLMENAIALLDGQVQNVMSLSVTKTVDQMESALMVNVSAIQDSMVIVVRNM